MNLKLGRLAARFPVALSALSVYAPSLPQATESWAGPNDSTFDYGMLGNDEYGDCTFAGFVHLVMAICLLLGVTPPAIDSPELIQAYLIFTHGQDSGAVEADVLAALYATGIVGIKIVGYAPGRGDLQEHLSMIQVFGAAYLGIMVASPMQEQFGAGELIDLTGTSDDRNIVGGHCIVSVGFDQAAETIDILTWGKRVKCTFRWMQTYIDEKWAVIPQQVKDTGTLDGFAWDQLEADLQSVQRGG